MQLDVPTHEQLIEALAKHLSRRTGAQSRVYRTHISSVIVCGEEAYKLKRPVKLAFVDFSTSAARRLDCLRELKLNRRTAPELYRDVVRITGTPTNPTINARTKTIDWAVKMTRFKQTQLLSHLACANRLSTRIALNLGEHHAQFINTLPRLNARQIAKHRPTQAWLLESLKEIAHLKPQLRPDIKTVTQWACDSHRSLRALIKTRVREGFYRPGHGDLHLGNLVMIGHQVVAFDALEFNEGLRQTDIINDIAFTFMDLLAYGRPDLAWAMINRWCELSADYRGLVLLRHYTLYRAVVRAKVACLSNDHQALWRYWPLAKRLTAPANTAKLVLVAGLSGSGKSTAAKELVKQLSAIQLRADVIRKQRYAKWVNQPAKLYAPTTTTQTYQALADLADELVGAGLNVIVDATFLDQTQIDRFTQLAHNRGIELCSIWCHAPQAVLKRRITQRARRASDPSDATVSVLKAQILKLQTQPLAWPDLAYTFDTHCNRITWQRRLSQIAHQILEPPAP
jgi:aminoglycoside phosphotransferase family enzyme/predicted kinase